MARPGDGAHTHGRPGTPGGSAGQERTVSVLGRAYDGRRAAGQPRRGALAPGGDLGTPEPVSTGRPRRRGRHGQQGRQRGPSRVRLRRGPAGARVHLLPRAPSGSRSSSSPRPVADCEWVWILHDDANPEPDALAALLAAAEEHPDADVLGPKLREWPSLKRLLELGVTISGTGRRETGLERGEYDQGQHDEVRTVLAVNTAGMLVRRRVLEELGGFDDQLPIFGNDVDFGWRAAAAGHRTLIVPQAVVFHAEAAHRGIRRTPLTGRHTHYQERRAALYTLLANSRARLLPFQLLRLGVGTILRMVGFLLVRSVGEALDELAALVSLYSRPREILRGPPRPPAPAGGHARRRPPPARAALAALPPRPRLPRRPALRRDQPGPGRGRASTRGRRPRPSRRRRRAGPRAGSEEEDMLTEDTGLVARFLTNPVALVDLALRGARPRRRPLGLRLAGRRRPLARPAGRHRRLVAPVRRVLAPAGPGHRRPGSCLRAAVRGAGLRCSVAPRPW